MLKHRLQTVSYTLEGHEDWVIDVKVTRDGRRAVSSSNDKKLIVWDLTQGRSIGILTGHDGSITSLMLTYDDKYIVSASKDGTVKIWSLNDGITIATFTGDSEMLACDVTSRNGLIVVAGENSGQMHFLKLCGDSLENSTVSISDPASNSPLSIVSISNENNSQQMTVNNKKQILILAANPEPEKHGSLRLDEEVRDIDEVLRRAQMRDQFELKQRWAVTYRELQSALLDEAPHIIHFCGHGTGEQGLVLQDSAGQAKFISTEALVGLFELFADRIECIVLNACYSAEQAQAICQHIDYVIGMKQSIGDRSAKEFAFGFYSALGSGKDYEFAYKFGRSSIRVAGSTKYFDVPELHQQSRPVSTTTPSLWIHGWKREQYEGSPTVELDWTEYYNRETRQIPNLSIWQETLFPNLVETRNTFDRMKPLDYIDFRGKLPLTATLQLVHRFQQLAVINFGLSKLLKGRSPIGIPTLLLLTWSLMWLKNKAKLESIC